MPSLIEPAVARGRLGKQPQPTFTGDGLVLRPFVASDADTVVRAYSDPDIQQWHTQTYTPDEAQAWIAALPEKWEAETGANWLIAGDDGAPLGRIGLNHVDLWQGQVELAYWALPEARGRRVVPRALNILLRYLFDQVGVHRVVLRHSVRNPASCRVAEKAGFRAEGILRDDGWHADGFHDMHLHARLADHGRNRSSPIGTLPG